MKTKSIAKIIGALTILPSLYSQAEQYRTPLTQIQTGSGPLDCTYTRLNPQSSTPLFTAKVSSTQFSNRSSEANFTFNNQSFAKAVITDVNYKSHLQMNFLGQSVDQDGIQVGQTFELTEPTLKQDKISCEVKYVYGNYINELWGKYHQTPECGDFNKTDCTETVTYGSGNIKYINIWSETIEAYGSDAWNYVNIGSPGKRIIGFDLEYYSAPQYYYLPQFNSGKVGDSYLTLKFDHSPMLRKITAYYTDAQLDP
jgi:hypothetical protein